MLVNGQNVQSNPLTIEAVKGNVAPQQQQQQQQAASNEQDEAAYSTKVSGEDVFFKNISYKNKMLFRRAGDSYAKSLFAFRFTGFSKREISFL